METITKEIRSKIYNQIVTTRYISQEVLKKLGNNTDVCIIVLIIDYYNGLLYKRISSKLNGYDELFLKLLENDSLDAAIEAFKVNPYYVKEALSHEFFFKDLSHLQQQDMMKFVHLSQDNNVLTRSMLYVTDMIGYMPSTNLKDITDDYKSHISMYGNDMYARQDALDIILHNIDEFKDNDQQNYENIMLEAIPEFYKYSKSSILYNRKRLKKILYSFLIRTLSKEDIIKYCRQNKEFEVEVIKLYLYAQSLPPEILSGIDNDCSKKLSKSINKKYDKKRN